MNLIYQKAIDEKLDMEWTSLILLSRKMGISVEEIRQFLKQCPIKENGDKKS
ncbi:MULTISPECIES: anti-repressor SinI family protein [Paenibacillus]|uniref:Anti-repressor SinI family protein n=1 Tax=Paenibacillus radicis (ex Xue et al. 2023) TaxID=2972489 RepID=A0ABT1YQV0_9BACL|nr:anti-repressor SinI family protein [Paenibacillus radicis (ex Xue et al. 2023)]MCR8635412.1 anti-repressor SinI family protein [Paenibacillus radicis (ex Xue et al. 2023)]